LFVRPPGDVRGGFLGRPGGRDFFGFGAGVIGVGAFSPFHRGRLESSGRIHLLKVGVPFPGRPRFRGIRNKTGLRGRKLEHAVQVAAN